MVIAKPEDVTKQGFCKMINTLKKTPSSGKSLISTYSFLGGAFSLWALVRVLVEGEGVGAYSRLGAY